MLEKIFCESERLIIRPVQVEDFEAIINGYRQCAPAMNRFDEVYEDMEFMTLE